MRILKRKMGLEEEKIELTEHELKRQDTMLSQPSSPFIPVVPAEKKQ